MAKVQAETCNNHKILNIGLKNKHVFFLE